MLTTYTYVLNFLCNDPLVGGYRGWSHASALRLLPTRHDASSCQCIGALMTSSPLRPLWMLFPSQNGYTALIWASKYNYLNLVKALIAAGADLNAKDNVGEGGNRLRSCLIDCH